MDEPRPGSYGRVSRPERYAVLHAAARELTDELAARFDVRVERHRNDTGRLDQEALDALRATAVDGWWLVPAVATAAPLGFLLTDFPGVVVLYGRWHHLVLPHCGCDACDEDPQELVSDLERRVRAVVAGFPEWLDRRGLHEEIEEATRTRGLDRQARRLAGTTARETWSSWSPRSARRR